MTWGKIFESQPVPHTFQVVDFAPPGHHFSNKSGVGFPRAIKGTEHEGQNTYMAIAEIPKNPKNTRANPMAVLMFVAAASSGLVRMTCKIHTKMENENANQTNAESKAQVFFSMLFC